MNTYSVTVLDNLGNASVVEVKADSALDAQRVIEADQTKAYRITRVMRQG